MGAGVRRLTVAEGADFVGCAGEGMDDGADVAVVVGDFADFLGAAAGMAGRANGVTVDGAASARRRDSRLVGVAAVVLAAAFGGVGTTAATLGVLARLAGRAGASEVEEVAALVVFAAFAGCAARAGATCFDVAACSAGSGAAFARADFAILAGFAAVRGAWGSTNVIGAGMAPLRMRAGLAVIGAFSDDLAEASPFGRSTLEAGDVAVLAGFCDVCAAAVAFAALMGRGWLAEAGETEEVGDIAVLAGFRAWRAATIADFAAIVGRAAAWTVRAGAGTSSSSSVISRQPAGRLSRSPSETPTKK
jgi:hypothetical protein